MMHTALSGVRTRLSRIHCKHRPTAALGRPRPAAFHGRSRTVVKASQQDPKPSDTDKTDVQQTVLDQLRKGGWDKDRAQAALSRWAKLGVGQDPEQLRKLLVKSSYKPLGAVGIQLLLDLGACAGGFFTAFSVGQGPPLPGGIVLEYIGYAIGCYYFLQVLVEGFALGTIATAVFRFNANPAAYLAAVEELAGPKTALSVVNKVQEMSEADPPNSNTLSNLSAYLTLKRAEETYGFRPEAYGLTEKQAGNIAVVFSELDLNDDGRLELSEVRRLCDRLGKDLNDAELKEAVRVLDTNSNGTIEFNEFVAWWTAKGDAAAAPQATTS